MFEEYMLNKVKFIKIINNSLDDIRTDVIIENDYMVIQPPSNKEIILYKDGTGIFNSNSESPIQFDVGPFLGKQFFEKVLHKFESVKMASWMKTLNKLSATYNITKDNINDERKEINNYKLEKNKTNIPNRAIFTGDKFPSSGNPANVELNAWKSQNLEYKKEKKNEDSKNKDGKGSPLTSGTSRYETLDDKIKDEHVNLSTSSKQSGKIAKNYLESFSDMSITKQPDGKLTVDIEENNSFPITQPNMEQQPLQNNNKENTKESSKTKEWEIKKSGNLVLIGKECKDYCGIGIYKILDNNKQELEFHRIAKNDHNWNELIPQGVWETKFDQLISKGQ